jgi:hypothetical protein
MHHEENFPHMLNEIFSELNKAATIRIVFRKAKAGRDRATVPGLSIVSVNGFTRLTTFTDCIKGLKAAAVSDLMHELLPIEPILRPVFMHQEQLRCRKLSMVTIPVNDPFTKGRRQIRIRHEFHRPEFDSGSPGRMNERVQKELFRLTRGYAYMWMLVEEMFDELQCLHFFTGIPPEILLGQRQAPVAEKIPVLANVPVVAAMARLLYDQ